jgi:adenine-specific DNA-methyltransferase
MGLPLSASLAKRTGAFYTPESLADLLASWTVRTGEETILEPCVGQGALVRAALRRTAAIGVRSRLRVIACDIDENAMEAVNTVLPQGSRMYLGDFLQLDPEMSERVDAVIANPPFTRHRDLDSNERRTLKERFAVKGPAGLWVYFLLHALKFIKPGGRLAAILPASALFTEYGHQFLERMAREFGTVQLYRLIERTEWSSAAEERGAVVLAEGYGRGPTELPRPRNWPEKAGNSHLDDGGVLSQWQPLLKSSRQLGSFATVEIGIVTGQNRTFLLDDQERQAFGIELDDVVPVVSRTRQLRGARISDAELLRLAPGEKKYLLYPSELGPRGSGVRRRLASITRERRRHTSWFRKRKPWWRVDVGLPCEAIMTYMNHKGPRLVLCEGTIYCTNTLHRVRFRDGPAQRGGVAAAAAISILSTATQLYAEVLGRSYGGGILKIEPAAARALPVWQELAADAISLLEEVDRALRLGQDGRARLLADKAILEPIVGSNWRSISREMEEALAARRSIRWGGGGGN